MVNELQVPNDNHYRLGLCLCLDGKPSFHIPDFVFGCSETDPNGFLVQADSIPSTVTVLNSTVLSFLRQGATNMEAT